MPARSPRFTTLAAVLPAFVLAASAAEASTAEAWETFRANVEASCLKAAEPLLRSPEIVVDPFGLESYGLAFLTGSAVEEGGAQSLVCVYDKARGHAEIGGTMALERAVPALQPEPAVAAEPEAPAPAASTPPAPAAAVPSAERLLSPSSAAVPLERSALTEPLQAASEAESPASELLAGRCDARCEETLEALAEADRAEILALPAEVRRVIDEDPDASLQSGPGGAREAAEAVAVRAAGEDVGDGGDGGGIRAPTEGLVGDVGCVLYYYGFGNEVARTVGRHRCSVSQGENGVLQVEKTSGERLQAELRPLTSDLSAFVGRTYLAGQSERTYDAASPDNAGNAEFGNAVGLAVENEGRLVLISSQQRRFRAPGDFFWVLAFDAP